MANTCLIYNLNEGNEYICELKISKVICRPMVLLKSKIVYNI